MAKAGRDLPVVPFKSQQAFDAWLASQPDNSRGLWLKIAKKSSGIPSISRDEAVDAALCRGWIDGQLDSFDDDHWLIRFTPRQPASIWSEKNRARALQLVELGVMRRSGLREIDRAKADGRWDRAYAGASTAKVPDDLRAALAKDKTAAAFFDVIPSNISGTESFSGRKVPANIPVAMIRPPSERKLLSDSRSSRVGASIGSARITVAVFGRSTRGFSHRWTLYPNCNNSR